MSSENVPQGDDQSYARKRRKFLQSAGAAGAVALAGCSGGGGSGDGGDGGDSTDSNGTAGQGSDGKEFTLLTAEADPASKELWSAAAADFEAETGHTLNIEYTSFNDQFNRIAQMVRGGNAPEFTTSNSSGLGSLYTDGLLTPVTDTVSAIEESVGEIPNNLVMKAEGESWVIPYAHKMQTQTFRQDLVNQVGGEYPVVDPTWDQHLDAVRKIDEQTDIRGTGMVSSQTNYATYQAIAHLWTNDVTIWDGPTDSVEVTMDSGSNRSRTVETLEHLKELHQYSPPATNWGWGETQEAFSTGVVADVNYSVGRILSVTRDIDEERAANTMTAQVPMNRQRDSGPSLLTASSGFSVLGDSENPDVAKEFIKFFYESEYYIDFILTVPFHLVPAVQGVFESDRFQNHEVISSRPDVLQAQQDLLQRVGSPALTAENNGYNPSAGKAYTEGTLGAMVAEVNINDVDPEDAIDQAAEELRSFV